VHGYHPRQSEHLKVSMKIRRNLLLCLVACALLTQVGGAVAQGAHRIQLPQIEDMFRNMRAKRKWNVDGPLLWGYYFIDPTSEKLRKLADELEKEGYRVVDIRPLMDKGVWQLHIEKVETHSPTTLDKRNQDFYALAEKYSVSTYDGMDVGPVQAASK
jgi:Regulator of ribonuclease activity B